MDPIASLIADAGRHHAAGNLIDAETAYRAAMARDPDRLDASAGLGIVLSQIGNHDEALRLLPHSLVFRTGLPLLLVARGTSLLATANPEEAATCLRRATEIDPNSHEAHNTLGCALLAQKKYLEAIVALRNALRLSPRYPEAYFNLGLTLFAAAMYEESAAMYRRAADLRPYPQALLNRGFALRKSGDMDAAIASFHEALVLSPSFDQAMHNLGATLADTGKVHEGTQWLRRAIATNPSNHHAHSALIYLLNFDPESTPAEMSLEQQRWQERHASPLAARSTPFTRDSPADPKTQSSALSPQHLKIRLAYISPDFRAHAEARFLLPLFENHNRLQFEIHCYSSVENPDDYTDRFRKLADRWHEVSHLTDDQLAARIREDRIDILIDLTMHMEGNRLLTFAQKPAPIQISWLAYPGTTGLRAIDFHITDPVLSRGEPESSEKPLALPDCWFCYQPDPAAPPVAPLPALSSSTLTFGSLNTFRKMNDRVIDAWARLLAAVAEAQPKSVRLILSCPEGSHRNDLLHAFTTRGILACQIELVPPMPYAAYFATYHRIDIALDPFPHNGATTTLDALLMGVPVLTCKGTTPTARLGESILSAAGLSEWIATDADDLREKGARISRDLPALANLRGTLRDRLAHSTLSDAVGFAQTFENALRQAQDRKQTL